CDWKNEGRARPRSARPFPPRNGMELDVRRLLARGRTGERRNPGLGDLALAAARLRRLERAARMEFAVGQTGHLGLPAEMEVRSLRVADRPAARAFGERLDRAPLLERDDQLLDRRREGLGLGMVERAQ